MTLEFQSELNVWYATSVFTFGVIERVKEYTVYLLHEFKVENKYLLICKLNQNLELYFHSFS